MSLRYRCLAVDHDDTSVMSTPAIHYPAHVEALRLLRPGREPIGLEGWLAKNFDPGLIGYLQGELGFDDDELGEAYRVWQSYTSASVPEFFPGLLEIYAEFKAQGGRLVVISHSEARMIERDYRAAGARGVAAMPDLVFGWEENPELRKPAPYPLAETMRRFGLSPREVLVLDDLKPGADMAASVGVDFAAAGWGHSIPSIKEGMAGLCRYYFESVKELGPILFDSP
jgi:phosphoglycolate phosphatase-like HAD superfamily hydrolase